MKNWQQHRQTLIAFSFVGIFFTLCRFSLDPTAGKRPVTAFAFPKVVPLPGWQLLESSRSVIKRKAEPSNPYEAVLASQKYLYRQNNQQMEIEMRYVVGTLGNIQGYLGDYTPIQLQNTQLLQLRQQPGVGFHKLFVYQGRSHLNACINPRGDSTINTAQFLANRQTKDLQLQRLMPWLLGKESLRDRRCLWVHLSVPLSQVSAETTYPVLEKAWLSWYQWWSSRFPQH